MSKVLEFGDYEEPMATMLYPAADIEVRPLKGEWWWVDKKEKYDGIYVFYSANKIPFTIEQQVFDNWAEALNPGAILHVVVPSFEYLCRMALQPKIIMWVKAMILNATNHYTMPQLRILMHRAGLSVMKAKTGEGAIHLYQQDIVLEQHYVAAINEDS